VKGVLPESDPHYPEWKKLREKRRRSES